MKKLFLPCFLLLIFISCGDEIDYTGTYISDKIERSDIRVFTKNGEIKNSSSINSFLSRHKDEYFNNSLKMNGILQLSVALKFLSTTEAEFTYSETKLYTVINKNNVIYLESKDTIDTGLRYYDYPGSQENIYDAMLKYSALYNDTVPMNINSDHIFGIRTKYCFYLNQSGNTVKMPFLSYLYHQPYGEHSGILINNSFDESCIHLLGSSDTLAIEQIQLVLRKK